MKIFFWAASDHDGTALYRIQMPARALRARGHDVQVSTVLGDWARDEAEIIVGQRVCKTGTSILWDELAAAGKHALVYEVDDDLLSIDPRTNDLAQRHDFKQYAPNIRANIRTADLLTVTTPLLAEAYSRFRTGGRPTAVLPNSIEERVFTDVKLPARRGAAPGPGTRIVLGWQGSATHSEDWKAGQGGITTVMREHPEVFMRFCGGFHPAGMMPGQWELLPWTRDLFEHYRRIVRFDVGVGPLQPTLFNRGKSPLRAVEMCALGVPAVYSRVPAYVDVVDHGVTGFLAKGPDEWAMHLRALVADHELRREVGDRARQVARHWTIERRIVLWEQAYQQLLSPRGVL